MIAQTAVEHKFEYTPIRFIPVNWKRGTRFITMPDATSQSKLEDREPVINIGDGVRLVS